MKLKSCICAFLLLNLVSCGSSPLFNHTKAPDPDQKQEQQKNTPNKMKFAKFAADFTVSWPKEPSASTDSEFHLVLDTSAPELFAEYDLAVELWMPDHGHGAPPVEIVKVSNREVIVRDMWFIMPGRWEVRLRLMKAEQVIDLYVFEVNL